MKREDLLRLARMDQRHTAMEDVTCPLDIVPNDLLVALIDSKSEQEFELLGYKMVISSRREYSVGGKPVFTGLDYQQMRLGVIPKGRLGIWYSKGKHVSVDDPDAYVEFGDITRKVIEGPWWTSVLTGNGIIAEDWFRERGFAEATNGDMASCQIREATEQERETYESYQLKTN